MKKQNSPLESLMHFVSSANFKPTERFDEVMKSIGTLTSMVFACDCDATVTLLKTPLDIDGLSVQITSSSLQTVNMQLLLECLKVAHDVDILPTVDDKISLFIGYADVFCLDEQEDVTRKMKQAEGNTELESQLFAELFKVLSDEEDDQLDTKEENVEFYKKLKYILDEADTRFEITEKVDTEDIE